MTPWDRKRYPKDWPAVVDWVLMRSGARCECLGECGAHAGPCTRRHGDPIPGKKRSVIMTTAHLWRGPCAEHHAAGIKCGDPDHLKSMCQRCHLAYDAPQHADNARKTRLKRKRERASGDLFGDPA